MQTSPISFASRGEAKEIGDVCTQAKYRFDCRIVLPCNRPLSYTVGLIVIISGAPNDGFLPNALKRCFRPSGVLLKLCRLILGCAKKILSVRFF